MQANEREQKQSSFPAVHCKDGCSALQGQMQCTAGAVALHCRKRVHNGGFGPPGTRAHLGSYFYHGFNE